jgi:hypothetical protein
MDLMFADAHFCVLTFFFPVELVVERMLLLYSPVMENNYNYDISFHKLAIYIFKFGILSTGALQKHAALVTDWI